MTRNTRIGVAAGAAVLILVVGAVPYMDHVATRRYERRLTEAVRARYGGELKMEGFRVSVLSATARADAVRYEDPPSASYRVTLTSGRVEADLEAMSLSPDVVRFREILLHRPDITITRTARGDWDRGVPGIARDLLSAGLARAKKALGLERVEVKASGTPGATLQVGRTPRTLEIGRLVIRDAGIHYEDHRFSDTPIRVDVRSFDFEGRELSGADVWRTLLTSEADATLEIGGQRIQVKGVTRPVEGQDKKVWSLEARGIQLAPLAGPVLRPLLLDVTDGTVDVRLSHLLDVSLAERSAILLDYDITTHGLALEVRDATGPRALLRDAAERVKAYVEEREGRVELRFSVEHAPDIAVFGKEAGNTLEVIGQLTFEALRKKLLQTVGLSGILEPAP